MMWSDFDDFDEVVPKKRRRIAKEPKKVRSQTTFADPTDVDQLITHSKKIEEIQNWLGYAGRAVEILLLTGPTGSAKTITLKVVAKNMNFHIQEWINPVDKIEFESTNWLEQDTYDSTSYREPKQVDTFEAFVFRSSRYQALQATNSKRIILCEDFPNHFLHNPKLFHNFLMKYKSIGKCPIVFICTDDEKINLSFDLFPQTLRTSLPVANIKFNPIPNTVLMKTLKTASSGLAKEDLDRIISTSNGDIRSALSQLQFTLSGGSTSKKYNPTETKDKTTDFYQTIGRVLYPKRNEVPSGDGKTFVHSVLEIAEDYNSTFLAMLQENFLDTFSSFSDVVSACNVLSEADLFVPHDEMKPYCGLSCVVGLMAANKQVKKGRFKPMCRSRWNELMKQQKDHVFRRYSDLPFTDRVLNLDIIPYVKNMSNFASKLSSFDSDRLRIAKSSTQISVGHNKLFKVPPAPVAHLHEDDEMVIEEYDD